MKKLIRTSSTGCNKPSKKALPNTKTNSSATTIRNKPKKALPEGDKQNILILEPTEVRNGKVGYSYKKKITQKKNKRSKSLIYDKKAILKVDMTHNSSRTIDNLSFVKREDTKEQISFPLVEVNQNANRSYADYSPVVIRRQRDYSTQTKNIMIEDAQIQCEQFQLEQSPQKIQQRQEDIREREELKGQIKNLQVKIDEVTLEAQQRQSQLTNKYEAKTRQLSSHVLQLKEQNLNLSKEKHRLEAVVKAKDGQISKHKETQKTLESCLKQETAIKQNLAKENEQSKRQIDFYKKELKAFEESLVDLRKMKGVYESRLDELEHEKIRIKKSAYELLQMVERYKNQEQSD